jgi:hypothetical protein
MNSEALNDCGCCGNDIATIDLSNPPGASVLKYRLGTHGSFKRQMLLGLSGQPELRDLRTREDDDPAIALIDGWAAVLDVLCFYSERTINEGFIRTATELGSLISLADEIGYVRSPGVAAAPDLAFSMDESPGSPDSAVVPIGTKVQSKPAQDQKPQTFETVGVITARREWNAMKAQTAVFRWPVFGDTDLWLQGTATGLQVGDAILLVGSEREGDPTSERWDIRFAKLVVTDFALNLTHITFDRPLGGISPHTDPASHARVFALRSRASIFGHNAVDWTGLPPDTKALFDSALTATEWPGFSVIAPSTTDSIDLDAVVKSVAQDSWIVLAKGHDFELYQVVQTSEGSRTNFLVSAKATRAKLSGENLSFFPVRGTAVFAGSDELTLAATPLSRDLSGDTITVQDVVTPLNKNQAAFVLGKRMRLSPAPEVATLQFVPTDGSVAVTMSAKKSWRVLAPPVPVGSNLSWLLEDEAGKEGTCVAAAADVVEVASLVTDPVVAERVTVEKTGTDGFNTTLSLTKPLAGIYDRWTVAVNANVAPATHGETRSETIGSGDPTKAFQVFTINGTPLTYVPAATPSGGASTLQIRINSLLAHEVRTF